MQKLHLYTTMRNMHFGEDNYYTHHLRQNEADLPIISKVTADYVSDVKS